MRKTTLLLLLLTIACSGFAQNKQQLSYTRELEVDPIAYAMKGYSVHLVQNLRRFRIDAGVFGIEQPAAITGNKGFSTMTRGFGVKLNYLLQGVRGFYTGVDAGYAANSVREIATGAADKGHNLSFGAHAGYRWFLFAQHKNMLSGLYITPWAGMSYNYVYDAVSLRSYKEGNIGYFATVHIGFRF